MRVAMLVLIAGLALSCTNVRADDTSKVWEFAGRTEASAAVEVRARVAGDLTSVADKEGATVKKGDILAEIDSRACRLDLDAAKARLKVAQAKLESAKIKASNAKRLLDNKVVSAEELDLSRAAEAEAEGAVLIAQIEVERARLTLS